MSTTPKPAPAEGDAPNTPPSHAEGNRDEARSAGADQEKGPGGKAEAGHVNMGRRDKIPADYEASVAAVARGIKAFTEAGLGGADAGKLALELYLRSR